MSASTLRLTYEVEKDDLARAGEASSQVKQTLRKLGFDPETIRRVAVCMYEGEINMVIHADGGQATVDIGLDAITVTLAEEPFVKAAWIKHGALIVQMATLEVEYDVVTNADKIVVDFWDTIKRRMASTIAVMASEGLVKDEDISASLGEILSGKKTGRDNDDQVIYFNSVGAGILDLAVTTRCYREALKRNVGTWVPYWV